MARTIYNFPPEKQIIMSEVERFQKTLTESYKDRDMPKTFCEEYNLKNRDDTWINYLPNWLSNSLRWCIDRLSKLLNRIFKKKINTKITKEDIFDEGVMEELNAFRERIKNKEIMTRNELIREILFTGGFFPMKSKEEKKGELDRLNKLFDEYENEWQELPISNIVGRSEQCCSPTDGFYLGTTCPHCNKPFRKDIR